ncbi:HlyD family efflux transporter periplasmic adaptor subunit [Acinetobacter lactucae]|uniref:HlyD family efflux transporter periplasmic adaptor subunit n=1 Tax=Acinetobacter lactucae TaxID=1785128 RepID=UPI000F7AAEAC|nr:HlyD family efflux transporter periplasmic adaptor subunit [Acinetobacter lactucae]RSO34244.1 HlyD family efflux transporter periplasmic adaptor subunit [Acinetobacter lactucae]
MFRKEAIEAQQHNNYGNILITRSNSSWLIVFIFLFIFFIVFLYIIFGSYTKKVTTKGEIYPVGGPINIKSPANGILIFKGLKEGANVTKDSSLFLVSDNRYDNDKGGDYLKDSFSILNHKKEYIIQEKDIKIQEVNKQKTNLQEQIENKKNDLKFYKEELVIQYDLLKSANELYKAFLSLTAENAASNLERDRQKEKIDNLKIEIIKLKKEIETTSYDISRIKNEISLIDDNFKKEIVYLNKESSNIDGEILQNKFQKNFTVRAPVNGVITAITAKSGEIINEGDNIAILLPVDSKLVANLYLKSEAIGFVEKGQRIKIRYKAYPYQKYGQYWGEIFSISKNPLPSNNGEKLYKITASLDRDYIVVDNKKIKLLSGMEIEADIEQENKRLIEWIIDPLYKFKNFF